jgi:hypothetical protein
MYKHSHRRIYIQGKFMALQPELDLLSVYPILLPFNKAYVLSCWHLPRLLSQVHTVVDKTLHRDG